MREKMNSMKIKLVVGAVILTLMGFLIFSMINHNIVNKYVSNMFIEKSTDVVTHIGGQIELLLKHGATTDEMQEYVENLPREYSYIAYAVVIDTNATAVVHSDTEKIGKSYADDPYTVDGCSKGKVMTMRFYADVQKAWTHDIMVPIYQDGQQYGAIDIGIYESHIDEILSKINTSSILSCVGVEIVVIVLMTILCNVLFKAFGELMRKCEQMGKGNLSEPINERLLKSKGEFGRIAVAMNHMREELRGVINKTSCLSEEIVGLSLSISEKTELTDRASALITTSINEVVDGTQKQSDLTEETSRMMEQISQGMDEVANNMQNVSESSATTVENAKHGFELVENMVNQMSTIQNVVNETADKIQVLSQKSEKIESVVSFITDIASQTNLLALNASIEAARAGEQGRGFAVVADQVGNLAEQSSKAANEIVELIKEIQLSTKDSIDSMAGSKTSIDEGITLAKQAGSGFSEILEQITRMSEDFTNISAVTEEVTASSNNLLSTVDNIAEISKTTNNNTDRVTEAVGQQNASMKEVIDAANALHEISKQLDETIQVFKL